MKKKAVEQLADKRLKQIEGLEYLLGERKKTIMRLKEEKTGLEQIIGMLESILFSIVEEKGKIVIKKEDISEGVRSGYKISIKEDVIVIEKVE